MNTFIQWEIFNKSDNRSLVISGNNIREIAEENAKKSALYYVNECQYNVKIEFREICADCFNTGIIKIPHKRNKWTYTTKKCPNCKGKWPNNSWVIE